MTFSAPRPATGSHATHDRLLVAAHAAGDVTGPELARAQALVHDCEACAALVAELASIAHATHDLPPAPRPAHLDFRITPEQADALARSSLWRRLLRPFARSGGVSRPLAATFTTLGVAGLLLASLPSMLPLGSGAAAPQAGGSGESFQIREDDQGAPEVPTSGNGGGTYTDGGHDTSSEDFGAVDKATDDGNLLYTGIPAPAASGGDRTTAEVDAPAGGAAAPVPTLPPLVLLSVGFLAAGLGLAALRLLATRLR